MSGKDEGVQQHLNAAGADKSTYFHCFADKLNLVLEKSINIVPPVNDAFGLLDLTTWRLSSTLYTLSYPCSKQ